VRAELAGLLVASESLAAGPIAADPGQLREQLTAIRRGTAWLQRYVDNLLCAEMLRRGDLRLRLQPTALEDSLREIQPAIRPVLLARGQALRIVRRGALAAVSMDRHRITLAMTNLVATASSRTPPAEVISLTLTPRKGAVRMAVEDRGPWLPEPVPAAGFGGALRELASTEDKKGRDDLSLMVVQAIVEAHDGRVGVANRPQGGVTYWLELPTLASAARR
jgi:K+-sensing histidine kinase KdpD